jgi:hypothetical protein
MGHLLVFSNTCHDQLWQTTFYQPGPIQRRFLETSGTIINDTKTITVILNRRAYSPVLRQSDLHADTAVPGGKAVTSASSSANRRHDSLHGNPR